jgi:hypothetical protein
MRSPSIRHLMAVAQREDKSLPYRHEKATPRRKDKRYKLESSPRPRRSLILFTRSNREASPVFTVFTALA